MDFSHYHLLLNHFPIIGAIVGVGLLLLSFCVNGQDLRRSSLIVFVVTALLTIPAFISGFGAQVELLENPAVSNDVIQRHLGSAELVVWFMGLTGALAAIGLWQYGGRPMRTTRWQTWVILLVSLATVVLLARTGNTGGQILHSEVQFGPQETGAAAFIAAFEPSPPAFTRLMIASQWWWAFMMTMHFVGLVLVVGTIGLLNLRVLGFAKQLPIGPLNKLVPWGLAGFGINVVTGLLAFIGMSAYYTYNIAFILKIVFVLLALASFALFYMTGAFRDCEDVGPGGDAPLRAKFSAGASLALWLAVIVLGRYIQPLENSIPR